MLKKGTFIMALMVSLLMSSVSYAITGDFKLLSSTYTNPGNETGGDVSFFGTINHGAIQSGKSIVVDVNYSYSFEYAITQTTGGSIAITKVCNKKKGDKDVSCTEVTEHVGGKKVEVIKQGSGNLIVKTEPTVIKGRLNPKGKITGYDWFAKTSIVPTDEIVDPSLIPSGATLVENSVEITDVEYNIHVEEADGTLIPDTVLNGILFE